MQDCCVEIRRKRTFTIIGFIHLKILIKILKTKISIKGSFADGYET
jgi:hypothetical protein